MNYVYFTGETELPGFLSDDNFQSLLSEADRVVSCF